MKRILSLIVITTLAVSCLDGGIFNTSYPVCATFEYGTASFDSDSLCLNKDQKIGLGWDYLVFHHKLDKETYKFQGGFLVSKLSIPESGVTAGLSNNSYRVNKKGDKTAPNSFAVFTQTSDMPDAHLTFGFKSAGGVSGTCTMISLLVNNTVDVAEMAESVLADPEAEAVLKLKATGYLEKKEVGTAEVLLVDTVKDSIMSHWTEFKDFGKLGAVDSVRFSLHGEGAELPKAVCMDNLIANISLVSE